MQQLFKCILVFLLALVSYGQSPYPQNYFTNPLNVPLLLGGTFAELRSNHFHSGLDIKTKQREGLHVLASAKGYVSRIKISFFGYGKALYITHPNGYTTVYAHLSRFSDKIEAFVKKQQYAKESYEIELFPKPGDLIVEKNEHIAYSGNTGSSGGPHLHFEIRDDNQRPVNPMLFGFRVKDTKAPFIQALYAYPLDENAHVNQQQQRVKIPLTPLNNNTFTTNPITVLGRIGFAVATIDQQDFTHNKNGVYTVNCSLNGQNIYSIEYKQFSFSETRHLNRLIDYELYRTDDIRAQKLFIEPDNPLSMYKHAINNGIVTINESLSGVYKINIVDFEGNTSSIRINLKGELLKERPLVNKPTPDTINNLYFIKADSPNNFTLKNTSISFKKNSFYDNFYATIKLHADTLQIHKDIVPLKKSFTIKYNYKTLNSADIQPLYIARLSDDKQYSYYIPTKKQGTSLIGTTRYLGSYVVESDTEAPKIQPVNFSDKRWISNNETLQLKIEDADSGISNYRATINGKWILMEYEYKKDLLTYHFTDEKPSETENNFKLIVTDEVGNKAVYKAVFYRKKN